MWNSDDTNTENYFWPVLYSISALTFAALLAQIQGKLVVAIFSICKKYVYKFAGMQLKPQIENRECVESIEDSKKEVVKLDGETKESLEARQNIAHIVCAEEDQEEKQSVSEVSEEYLDLSRLKKLALVRSGVRQDRSESPRIRAITNSYVPDVEEFTRNYISSSEAHPLTIAFERFKKAAKEKKGSDMLLKKQKKTEESAKQGCCVIS